MEKLTVFNIQRFCTQDGPGIRTTVFLKGCGLRCAWCHNPESQLSEKQLMYRANLCRNCLRCVGRCPRQCHGKINGRHQLDRTFCNSCGLCLDKDCPALEIVGYEMTVPQILGEITKDILYYQNSGGGLTLSGGEPLYQPGGCLELLKGAKAMDIHTCIETCGFAPRSVLDDTLPWTDLYLFDVKETDPQRHIDYTNAPLQPIIDNLRYLDSKGKETILRCPIVPKHNDRSEHIKQIAKIADQLTHVRQIEIEPYHTFGVGKYEQLGLNGLSRNIPPLSDEEASRLAQLLQAHTNVPVLIAGGFKL